MKTKKHFIGMALFAIIALVFTVGASGSGTKGSSTPAQETIVCLGDSWTSGASATVVGKDDKNNAWPAFLQKKVNIPVINAGVGGNTTGQALARVKKDVLSQNPRIVIIALGGNDTQRKTPMAKTKDNLQKIIDMVNDGNRKIYLANFSIPKPIEPYSIQAWDGTKVYTLTITPELVEQYVNMYKTLASSNNIEFIEDFMDGVWPNMAKDNIHPNVKGCEILAENYFKALKPYLEANNLLKE